MKPKPQQQRQQQQPCPRPHPPDDRQCHAAHAKCPCLGSNHEPKMSHKLSDPWPMEYAAEHAEIYREKEQLRRTFFYQSPQSQHRTYLVGWVRLKAEKLKFCTCSVHLAIYILDVFMDNFSIDVERLHLVCLACLLIASKYEERDLRIPKLSQLNNTVNNRYTTTELREMEVMMLSFLDWNLNLPTAAHFAEYYSLFAVTRKDWDKTEYNLYETFWQEAQRAIKDYLDLSLLDVNMMQFLPSLVACACILLARQQLRLTLKWTDELQMITRYCCDDLTECANTILSRSPNRGLERKRKLVNSPDTGYVSGGSNLSTPEEKSHKRRVLSHGESSISYAMVPA